MTWIWAALSLRVSNSKGGPEIKIRCSISLKERPLIYHYLSTNV